MRIAILGTGSLGTIMGALVSKNGGKCTLIDTNKAHVDALNKNGATVIPDSEGFLEIKNAPVEAITPDQMEGIYDMVFVLVKQTANEVALKNLLPHLDENSIVCTLQNGVPEEFVPKIIDGDRVVGGCVHWGGYWKEPGVSIANSEWSRQRYDIGEIDGKITDRIKKVQDFLKLSGNPVIHNNLMGVRWSKLLVNSAMSGMSAALNTDYEGVYTDDKSALCAAHVADELIKVTKAKGIELEIVEDGWDFYDFEFNNAKERENTVKLMREFFYPLRKIKASMLQDMEKGINSEIHHINGLVCELGRECGVATPINDAIVKIVSEFEAGTRPMPSMETLDEFIIPELS